jgi:cytochrome c peroxidase
MLFFVLLLLSPILLSATEEEADPAEIAIGERLFLETRFAQFFAANNQGGDPAMDTTETIDAPLPGPFAGQSMNCVACHLVDQQLGVTGGSMRTYADFARRSPLQAREDGKTHSVRNSPPLVNASLPRKGGIMLHFDGEFSSIHDLVKATYTGRMAGWLPGEREEAIKHFAKVIRNDDGNNELAQEFGGAYSVILKGTDPSIPDKFRLPEEFRIDVAQASDEEIFEKVTRFTAAYVENLQFSRDEEGNFNLSPYDLFLIKNNLPRGPAENESDTQYSRRLLQMVKNLDNPTFISEQDGFFAFHDQAFVFGLKELEGMKLFFSESEHGQQGHAGKRSTGNCIACHQAPNFTDFGLHNTGVAQDEYDAIHGKGAFKGLHIPNLRVRNSKPMTYLPATDQHPAAMEPFRAIPDINKPEFIDLGVWNIYANPNFPKTQSILKDLLCQELKNEKGRSHNKHCKEKDLLKRSIAMFKTPGLRDLGHSAPYMHNGQFDSLENVIEFYQETSKLARKNQLRNASPDLIGIHIEKQDVASIAAFLRALNEDYE